MFLKNIWINNYRSIQNAKVDFEEGLNILIGKNGVGKSNLLKFINQNVSYFALTIGSRFQRNTSVEFEYTVCFDDSGSDTELTVYLKRDKVVNNNEIDFNSEIKLTKKVANVYVYTDKIVEIPRDIFSKIKGTDLDYILSDFDIMSELEKSYVFFEIPSNPVWLATSVRYELNAEFNFISENAYTGFGLLNYWERLLEIDFFKVVPFSLKQRVEDVRPKFIKKIFTSSFETLINKYNINEYLSKYSPISEIRLNPNLNVYFAENKILIENLIIDFKINNAWVPWSFLSDGTKRLFYLISQCLCIESGLLLIEEPELGIHPHQLFSLMQFIKEQSNSKQIILSTHSPIVLDILSPDELNKITIVKLLSNGTEFHKLDDEQKETAKEYMEKVGEISYYWLHSDLENE